MRGGALPVIAWGCLLAALMATNAIWTGDDIQIATFAFAMLVILSIVTLLAISSRRRALRRGAPERDRGVEGVPEISFGTALAGLGLGGLVFGLAFGHFFIYFGAGLIVIGLARVAVELRAERRSVRQSATDRHGTPPPSSEGTR
jgi:hypothetical protein